MLTILEFENLINRPESSILDFKAAMYEFENDPELKKVAEFVKDVISFTNTVRNETSYIIIGIEEKNGEKIFHGLNKDIDDAILQDKVKNKVHPRPFFSYYSFSYNEKKYGILEFPIKKYSMPISPIVKMKGLDVGTIYYRHSTTNTIASGMEVIRINNWMQSLPDNNTTLDYTEEINKLIIDLTKGEKKLSLIISEIYTVAKKYQFEELLHFCTNELKGINSTVDNNEFKYRIQDVFVTPLQISINPYSNYTSNMIKNELRSNEDVYEYKMIFPYPISQIENFIAGFGEKTNQSILTFSMSSKQIFGNLENGEIQCTVLVFHETIVSLYANIRQNAIDKLMGL